MGPNQSKIRRLVSTKFVKLVNNDIIHQRSFCDYGKMGGDEIEVSDDESSDLEEYWSDKDLDDSELKYKALRNKAIMKGLISDAMIVGKDGRAMRFTTKVMIKGNMKTKLMKNDMNYVVSELTRCQSAK
ncbi:hypothetical protein Tco_0699443 [Tanacetum coccineum]